MHYNAVKIFLQKMNHLTNYEGICRAAPGFARVHSILNTYNLCNNHFKAVIVLLYQIL